MTGILFNLTFPLVVPFWALIIALPHWPRTSRIIGSPLIAVAPIVIYLIFVVPQIGKFWDAVSSPELAELQALLGTPSGAAAIWAHLIAFDLLVGRWIYLDSRERAITPWLVSPLLALTILLAPVGYLLYLCARYWQGDTSIGRVTAQSRT